MQVNLQQKRAIVTGAAQGIGEALARRLGAEGCRVAVADVNIEAARAVAHALPGAVAVRCDVSDPAECEALAGVVTEEFGGVDYLVSNAGILIAGGLDSITYSDWQRVIQVNLVGFFNIVKAVAPTMQAGSSIVQINSKSGKRGSFKNSAYAASKFGGIGLVQSLALELAERNIRVNAICPGNLMHSPLWRDSLHDQYAKTRGMTRERVWQHYESQVPLGRTCTYADVEDMLVYLLSDHASYITGQAWNVTGGFEMN